MDSNDITRLTEQYGTSYGLNHTLRLLDLVASIADGQAYNTEAVWIAAHLHDWGGYPPFVQPDVDHAVRSREVADAYLSEHGCPDDLKTLVLGCIEHHHSGDPNRSFESILLSDADAIDFLGVTGAFRCFAMMPRDLRKGYEYAKHRRAICDQVILLPKARELAAPRFAELDRLLEAFQAETGGKF